MSEINETCGWDTRDIAGHVPMSRNPDPAGKGGTDRDTPFRVSHVPSPVPPQCPT